MMHTREHTSRERGMSVVSLIISIALIAVLATLTLQAFSSYATRQALRTDSGQIASMLEVARERTLASDKRTQYGVRITETSAELFRGGAYSPENVESTHTLSPQIAATTTLTGGSDIVFVRLTGKVATPGTITVYVRKSTTTAREITITSAGLISAE